jgi:hypothetical protein
MPAGSPPGSHKFFRAFKTFPDTDGDCSTDSAEFEIQARHQSAANHPGDPAYPTNPTDVLADPFDPDKDKNGVADGKQLDRDNDSTPDADDGGADDPTFAPPFASYPRYAFFNIPGSATQINSLGTVLFPNFTWKGGDIKPLAGIADEYDGAGSINDSDLIIGRGARAINVGGGLDPWETYFACYWRNRNAPRQWVEQSAAHVSYAGDPSGTLSEDGVFSSKSYYIRPNHNWTDDSDIDAWQIAPNGTCRNLYRGNITNQHDGNLRWGYAPIPEAGGVVYAPNKLPFLPIVPYKVVRDGTRPNTIFALDGYQVYASVNGGAWGESPAYWTALDICADGTAAGNDQPGLKMPVLLNNHWMAVERHTPGLPARWMDGTAYLHGASASGWLLAYRGSYPQASESGALLPVRIRGTAIDAATSNATGVDTFSIGSTDPGETVKDRQWIMAPAGGGSTPVSLVAPLNA